MNLKERTRWAIEYIKKKEGLSNNKIAKVLEIKSDTVNAYRAMLANPKVDFIIKFCDIFGVNLIWLTKGEGEPFPGANIEYPEICSPSMYDVQSSPAKYHTNHSDRTLDRLIPSLKGVKTNKKAMINLTEKSLRELCKLIDIPLSRGWKTLLAKHLNASPAQLSNAVSRDRISKNLLLRISETGYPPEKWLIRRDNELKKWAVPEKINIVDRSKASRFNSKTDLIKMAGDILESKTTHAATLAMIIISLESAVDAEKMVKKMGHKE